MKTRTNLLVLCSVVVTMAGCSCKKSQPQQAAPAPGVAAAPSKPAEPSMAGRLLLMDDAKALIKGDVSTRPLAGIPESANYSSQRYFAAGSPVYGIAVQFWKLGDGAEAAYMRDLGAYPRAAAHDEVGTRSFRAYRDGLMYVYFLDKPTGYIASVTCDISICSPDSTKTTVPDQMRWELIVGAARAVQGRFGSIK